jgi:hypothetical protein
VSGLKPWQGPLRSRLSVVLTQPIERMKASGRVLAFCFVEFSPLGAKAPNSTVEPGSTVLIAG